MNPNIYSQNSPISLANVTPKGVTYSYGETNTTMAISLAYDKSLNKDIKQTVLLVFPLIENGIYTIDNNNVYFFIDEMNGSTKLELRLKQTYDSLEEFDRLKTNTKLFFKSILEL